MFPVLLVFSYNLKVPEQPNFNRSRYSRAFAADKDLIEALPADQRPPLQEQAAFCHGPKTLLTRLNPHLKCP